MTRRAWLLFLAMSVIWGIPYLFIKVAVAELSPFVVVFLRAAVAASVLLPVAVYLGALAGLRARWRWLLAIGLIEITIPFLLITGGEQHISSSLAGIMIAADPLFIALLALRFDPSERVDGLRLAGLGLGLVGVIVLLGVNTGGDRLRMLGALMVLGAAACYAVGTLMVKRMAGVSNLGVATVALLITAIVLLPAALATRPQHVPGGSALAAVLVLGFVCTAVGFLGYFALIHAAGASRSAVITYVNPAVAAALGAAVLREAVTASTLAGFLLIIAGSWISTGGRPDRLLRGRPRPAPALSRPAERPRGGGEEPAP